MPVKDPDMKQVVLAAKYARVSSAPDGSIRLNDDEQIEWGLTTIVLTRHGGTIIAGPIGEFAELGIE